PGVVGSHDADVIRDDVQNVAHAVRAQLRHEAVEFLAAADLRVEGVVIDDVITVGAARARPEVGGAVDVTDAKRREVGDDRGQVLESESSVELYAVRGAGNPGINGHGCARG